MDKKELREGKNGLRNFAFEKVQKDKVIHHYDPRWGSSREHIIGMFYTKKCLFCKKQYEARRIDSTFCSQGCQKAHKRMRNTSE